MTETRTIYAGQATGVAADGDAILDPVGSYAVDMFSDGLDSTYVELHLHRHDEFYLDTSGYSGIWDVTGLDIPNPYGGVVDPATVTIETFIRTSHQSGYQSDINLGMAGNTLAPYSDFFHPDGTLADLGPGTPGFSPDYPNMMAALSLADAGYTVSAYPTDTLPDMGGDGIEVLYEMRCVLTWDVLSAVIPVPTLIAPGLAGDLLDGGRVFE